MQSPIDTNNSAWENNSIADPDWPNGATVMSASNVMHLSLEAVICLLTVGGNLLTILAAVVYQSLRKPTNYLIINLALVDFLVGAFAIPFSAIAESGLPRDSFYGCLIMNCIVLTFTQVSFINLLAIAVEILVAVRYPLRYRSLFTRANVSIVCCILWLCGGLLGFIPLMGWNKGPPKDGLCSFVNVIDLRYYVYVVFFGWAAWIFLVVFSIYAAVFIIIQRELSFRRHRSGTGGGMISDARRHQGYRQSGDNRGVGGDGGQRGISKATVKAAKRMSVIVLAFAVSWIPLNIHNALVVMRPSSVYPDFLVKIFILLTHANSAVNPLVYALSHPQFRLAYATLICCSRLRPDFPADASNNCGSRGGGAGGGAGGGGIRVAARGNQTVAAAAAAASAAGVAAVQRLQSRLSVSEPQLGPSGRENQLVSRL